MSWIDDGPDGLEVQVRQVQPYQKSTKPYLCPGCGRDIPAATGQRRVVVPTVGSDLASALASGLLGRLATAAHRSPRAGRRDLEGEGRARVTTPSILGRDGDPAHPPRRARVVPGRVERRRRSAADRTGPRPGPSHGRASSPARGSTRSGCRPCAGPRRRPNRTSRRPSACPGPSPAWPRSGRRGGRARPTRWSCGSSPSCASARWLTCGTACPTPRRSTSSTTGSSPACRPRSRRPVGPGSPRAPRSGSFPIPNAASPSSPTAAPTPPPSATCLRCIPPVPWEWERFITYHASVSVVGPIPISHGYAFSLLRLSDVSHLPAEMHTR